MLPLSLRWEMIWWESRFVSASDHAAYKLAHSSAWLYGPSIKHDPIYILGLGIFREIEEWLGYNDLQGCLRNGADVLIFDTEIQIMAFNLAYGDIIKEFGYEI